MQFPYIGAVFCDAARLVWVSMQFPYIGALFCDAAALSKT
jgi:hypothetical protein